MTQSVTAGVDGSRESLTAAAWAAGEARRRELPLRLVYAWDWQPQVYGVLADPATHRACADEVLAKTAALVRKQNPDVEVTAERADGPPAAVLSAEAGRSAVLALGSRGLGGLAGFLVGSVSQATLARAERPVVVVRGDDEDTSLPAPEADVVLGLDLQEPHDDVIAYAFESAERQHARLRIVHGVTPPAVFGDYSAVRDPGVRERLLAVAGETLTSYLAPWKDKFPRQPVVQQVEMGRPAGVLLDASSGASLVVVGRRISRIPLGPRIGAVTHAALHHCRGPVAVVPHA
ncbi:universal stress protein [Streptomyces sannanensis]|uniref:Universal stress protein n=1 Tax=Streptomyces sannanensis TaxID=285536 RepID=A0ABP6SL81_9ACTN